MTALILAPLEGEILAPAPRRAEDGISVIAIMHPFRLQKADWVEAPGTSIAEIVATATGRSAPPSMRTQMVVWVGSELVPQHLWSRIRLKAGTHIVVRAVPQGGGGLMKNLLMLAVTVLVGVLMPYLAPLGFFGKLIGLAITIGASLLLNALFPVKAAKKDDPIYSISAPANKDGRWQSVPVLLGKMRVYPFHGADPYTEFSGSSQFLRQIMVYGYGPLKVEQQKIGETPIDAYDEIDHDDYAGRADDPAPTLYPRQVIQDDESIDVLEVNGWQTRQTATDCIEYQVDIIFPNGLQRTNDKGKINSAEVDVQIQARLLPSGSFVEVYNRTFSSKSTKIIRYTFKKRVASGQYELRFRKTRPDHTGDSKYIETCQITAIRSYRPGSPLAFRQPLARTDVRIKATGQLNGAIGDWNAICTSLVLAFNGSTWRGGQPSSNPADLFRYVLQGPAIATPVANSRIDLDALEAWWRYCKTEKFEYNRYIDQPQSIYETLRDICSAGRAAVVIKDGKWSVHWDDRNLPITAVLTPRNSWNFKGQRAYRQETHAFRIKFANAKRGWRADERIVYNDGYNRNNATLIETLDLPWCTDSDLAWRHARFHLAQAKLRPETYTLNVDWEHLIMTRGDRVLVTHDIPMFGILAARCTAYDGVNYKVTLDEQVLMESGKTYGISWRTSTGAIIQSRRVDTITTGYLNVLTFSATPSAHPVVGDLVTFGEYQEESVVLRVLAIKPGDDFSAELTLVDDAPEISDADTGAIPDYDSQITDAPDPMYVRPYGLKLVESSGSVAQGYVPRATLMWQVIAGSAIELFEIQFKDPNDADFGNGRRVRAPAQEISWVDLDPGVYTFRVRGIFPGKRQPTAWSPSLRVNILSRSAPMPEIKNFQVNVVNSLASFSWSAPLTAVSETQIRYNPALTGATWQNSAPLIGITAGTTATVPIANGTYLGRFVGFTGALSPNTAVIVVTNADLYTLNVVETMNQVHPFRGTHVNTYDNGTAIQLDFAEDVFSRADFFGVDDFFIGDNGVETEGFYYLPDTLDLGATFTSRVSAYMQANGYSLAGDFFSPLDFFDQEDIFNFDANDWSASLQCRVTNDAPIMGNWSEWMDVVSGDMSFRAVQFRVHLQSFAPLVTPFISSVNISVDMPDRDIIGKDVTVPSGGLSVVFDPPLKHLSAVPAINGQGMGTGDYYTITAKSENGFTIIFKNAAGVGVARTMDYLVKGYGKVLP